MVPYLIWVQKLVPHASYQWSLLKKGRVFAPLTVFLSMLELSLHLLSHWKALYCCIFDPTNFIKNFSFDLPPMLPLGITTSDQKILCLFCMLYLLSIKCGGATYFQFELQIWVLQHTHSTWYFYATDKLGLDGSVHIGQDYLFSFLPWHICLEFCFTKLYFLHQSLWTTYLGRIYILSMSNFISYYCSNSQPMKTICIWQQHTQWSSLFKCVHVLNRTYNPVNNKLTLHTVTSSW